MFYLSSLKGTWDDSIWENIADTEPKLEWETAGTVDSSYTSACLSDNPLDDMDTSGGYYLIGGSGGSASQAKTELLCLSQMQTSAVLAADYKMTASVDFGSDETAVDWNGDGSADGATASGWNPIGDYGRDTSLLFTGTFDGDGHLISNLYINKSAVNFQGLFGRTSGATIQDLGLADAYVYGLDYSGLLIGYAQDDSIISSAYSSGTMIGRNDVGGLIGDTNHSGTAINNCYSTADVTGGTDVGGLLGWGNDGDINNSYATGTVSGTANLGAIAGRLNSYSSMYKSYAINSSTTAISGKTPDTSNYCSYDFDASCVTQTIRDSGWDDAIWGDLSSDTPQLEWE